MGGARQAPDRKGTLRALERHDAITAPCEIDGPINCGIFRTSVEQMLMFTLRQGNIVILDNLASQKAPAIGDAIRAARAKLFFLPASSPYPCVAKNSPPDCFLNAPHPSNRYLPNSNTSCQRPPNAAKRPSGAGSAPSSTGSAHRNAKTASETQAMVRSKPIPLYYLIFRRKIVWGRQKRIEPFRIVRERRNSFQWAAPFFPVTRAQSGPMTLVASGISKKPSAAPNIPSKNAVTAHATNPEACGTRCAAASAQ